MKIRLLAVLAVLLLLTGCGAPPSAQAADARGLCRESVCYRYASPEVKEAIYQYLEENDSFQKQYGEQFAVRYLKSSAQLLRFLWLEKGELQSLVEIGGDLWRLDMEKTFFQEWTVTGCRLCP